MAKVKVSVMLRKNAPKSDGTFPIIVRQREGNLRKDYSIGYSVFQQKMKRN